MSTETIKAIKDRPKCDFCDSNASYDAVVHGHSWANVCDGHFKSFGCTLGTGYGQKFMAERTKTNRKANISISLEDYESMQDEYNGLCLACGEIKYGDCEPDASGYPCDECGANKVEGLENCLVMGLVQ